MNDEEIRSLGFSPRLLAKAINELDQYTADAKIPGYSLALMQSTKPAIIFNGGHSNLQSKQQFDQYRLLRLASLTKPIMSVLVMRLVEQGFCRLSDAVSQYLPEVSNMRVLKAGTDDQPEYEPINKEMTLHDLLCHRAGFGYDYNVPAKFRQYYNASYLFDRDSDNKSLLNKLLDIPLLFQPGDGFRYGLSTDLLGCLLERIVESDLDSIIASNICQPLQMHNTSFYLPADRLQDAARLYALDANKNLREMEGAVDYKFNPELKVFSAGSGLMSNLYDYTKFARLFINQGQSEHGLQILSKPALQKISMDYQSEQDRPWSLGRNVLYDTDDYGFGYNVKVLLPGHHKSYSVNAGEFAWAGMNNTYFWVEPQFDLAVLLFINCMPFARLPIDPKIKSLIYNAYVV